jgi:engulfment/cell motility protein 1
LYYVDSAVKFPIRRGTEDLPERIEVALISEIATMTGAPSPNVLRDQNDLPPGNTLEPSPLSFSLLSIHEGSLADLVAPDLSRWADWTDGLNMLRKDGGHVASNETAGFVNALTEIGLKIKLLGERQLNFNWPHSNRIQIYLARWSIYPTVKWLDHHR